MKYHYQAGVIVPFAQKFYKQLILAVAAVFIATMAAMSLSASAATETIDFEPTDYIPGDVHGQDGWSETGEYDVEIVNNTSVPEFGDQSLRISNAITSGSFGDHAFSKPLTDEAGETSAENDGMSGGTRSDYFEASLDFTSAAPEEWQEGLTLNISPDRGDGARMSYVGLRDVSDGLEVFFYDYQVVTDANTCDGTFPLTPVASGLDRGTVHNVKIQMEFIDGPSNDVVTVTVNGTETHVGTSWEDYFTGCESNPTRTVDSLGFFTRGVAAPGTEGNGFYIDNLNLTTEEPADEAAPTAPVAIGATSPVVPCGGTTDEFNVTLGWTASTDNVGVTGYEYNVVTPNNTDWTTTVSGTSYSGAFNDGEGAYTYMVRAFDAAGNFSEWSNACAVSYDDPDTNEVLGSKDECKNGGWTTSDAPEFKNQGHCVSHFASDGNSTANRNKNR